MKSILRASICLAGIVLLTAGCSGERDDAPTQKSTSSTATTIPRLKTTGTDWSAIVDSMIDYENWLFAHPDPKRVADYMDTGCSCYAETETKLQKMQERGWHVDGSAQTVRDVRLVSNDDAQTVTLAVSLDVVPKPVVDANGAVKQELGGGTVSFLYKIVRGPDDRWRIRDAQLSSSATTTTVNSAE